MKWALTLRAYSYEGEYNIGLDWDWGTMKSYPLGNLLYKPIHKSVFPWRDLLNCLHLVLALKNWSRMCFSNAYKSFKFPQQMFLATLSINILTESCCLISFLPSQYLPLCYLNRGHLFLLSFLYFAKLKIEILFASLVMIFIPLVFL